MYSLIPQLPDQFPEARLPETFDEVHRRDREDVRDRDRTPDVERRGAVDQQPPRNPAASHRLHQVPHPRADVSPAPNMLRSSIAMGLSIQPFEKPPS